MSDHPIYVAEAPPQPVTGATTGDAWLAPPNYPPPDARPRRRWRVRPRSLTGRLVLFVVALIVLIVALTSGATWALLRPYLTNRLDQQLAPAAARNEQAIAGCIPIQDPLGCPFGSRYHSPQRQWITILPANAGVRIAINKNATDDWANMQLSAEDAATLLRNPGVARTLTTVDGANLRVMGRPLTTPDGSPYVGQNGVSFVVVTGLSTGDEQHTLSRLLGTELAIGAGAVVLAIVLTSAGVRIGLRPLLRVTRTAREVSAELSPAGAGLDRRVPVAETDTEVGQLAESVNTMLGAVETQFAARLASEERMRQFLADASHELRTPLTTIRGYAELARLQRAAGPADKDAEADTLDRIESEGVRMARLVDDLLLLARSDQGTPPPRQIVEVDELISDVVAGARAAHPKRRIDVVVPVGLDVPADPDQLMRVVRNLVTNAAVHTAPSGAIRVSARRLADTVEIQVSDAGPGLPPEEAAHVFERFWRADKARTRARGGSGLGLSIVLSIVEAHGGTVRFDSSPEAGSTVTVTLPID